MPPQAGAPMGATSYGNGWPPPVSVPVNNAPNYQPGGVPSMGGDFAQLTSLTAGVVPGKVAAGRVGMAREFFQKAKVSRSAKTAAARAADGRSALMGSVGKATLWSAIINTVTSIALNGIKLSNKEISKGDFGANVAGDAASAVIGGAAGGIVSTVGTMAVASIFGMTGGLPLTLIGMALGCVGYFVADKWAREQSWFRSITDAGRKLAGGV